MIRETSVAAAQERALMDGLEKDLHDRRQELLARAHEQARELLRDARRKARERAREAIEDERRERAGSLQTAEAALATRIRRKRLAVDLELVERGGTALRAALERRWSDPDARGKWLSLALAEAAQRLPSDGWRLEFPHSLDEAWLRGVMDERTDDWEVELQPVNDLEAGFRIRRAGALLDLGLAGLLAREERVASLLLAELRRGRERSEEAAA